MQINKYLWSIRKCILKKNILKIKISILCANLNVCTYVCVCMCACMRAQVFGGRTICVRSQWGRIDKEFIINCEKKKFGLARRTSNTLTIVMTMKVLEGSLFI